MTERKSNHFYLLPLSSFKMHTGQYAGLWTQTDLPTLNHANLESLKKSSQKPGDFHNMCQTKPKRQIIFVMVFLTLSVVSVVLSCCSFGSDEKISVLLSIRRWVVTVKLRKPWTPEKFQECWLCTGQSQDTWGNSKPQTNYRCCLRFSYLDPYWLISCNTITFHFWCSRFCEFHSKSVQWNPTLLPPCYYSYLFLLPSKTAIHFLVKTLVKWSLINQPNFGGPLVTILTGFHCIL